MPTDLMPDGIENSMIGLYRLPILMAFACCVYTNFIMDFIAITTNWLKYE